MNAPDSDGSETPPKQRGSFLTLPVIFVVGWIIYEVTHNPAMAAMAMCLKFGWEDFRTARWLWRTDPDRNRGRACYWLYLASGLWQTAVIGVAMVLLTVALDQVIQVQQQGAAAIGDLFSLLRGAFIAILFGFVFSSMSTYIALLSARRYGVHPWLNGSVHIARRQGHWPPLYGHRNRVMVLVVSTVIVTFLVLVPAILIVGSVILQPIVPGKILEGFLGIILLFSYVILMPASIVLLVILRRHAFFAQHPADCWGEEPLPMDGELEIASED